MSSFPTVADLLDKEELARRVAVKFRDHDEVTVADAATALGVPYGEMRDTFKTISNSGGGQFKNGRRGGKTRILWSKEFHEVITNDEFQAAPKEGLLLEQASIKDLISALKTYHNVGSVSLTY